MRFCKQRDKFSCGAVALLNADKFFGRRVTYRSLPLYKKLVRTGQHGTYQRDMTRVLGRASRRGWKQAKRFLQEGNCIIVDVRWRDGEGHYYLMVIHNYDIQIVNYFKNLSTYPIDTKWASQLLKQARRTWYVNEGIL